MLRTQLSVLPETIDVRTEFPQWVSQHCDSNSVVLDVGAGRGEAANQSVIQQKVARLVGIDPDAGIALNPYLDEKYQSSIEEFARNRGAEFDRLYTMFVLEHVARPSDFLFACKSLLKPGGMLFGVTPNLWHYFGMTTKLSSSIGVEDWLLDRLIGSQVKASYHFSTTYRLNSIPTIGRALEQTGFREVEFKCFDQTNRFEGYFPRSLRWFPGVYSRLAYTLNLPHVMGFIMFRATA